MKSVLVTLRDTHTVEGESESYEVSARGVFSGDENDYSIEYNEDYGDGSTPSRTTVRVTGKKQVSIRRTGTPGSEMIIEENKRHSCCYTTPYGNTIIGIYGINVFSDVANGAGTLIMEYTIDFNSVLNSENKVIISIA